MGARTQDPRQTPQGLGKGWAASATFAEECQQCWNERSVDAVTFHLEGQDMSQAAKAGSRLWHTLIILSIALTLPHTSACKQRRKGFLLHPQPWYIGSPAAGQGHSNQLVLGKAPLTHGRSWLCWPWLCCNWYCHWPAPLRALFNPILEARALHPLLHSAFCERQMLSI